jgi:hypothetical protein
MSNTPIRIIRTANERDTMPSDAEVLDALATSKGIAVRAAAELNVAESYVLGVVTRNPRALSTRLRSILMLETFSTLMEVQRTLMEALADMPTDAVGRTYASTLAAFSALAGQFEEKEASQEDDDTEAVKDGLLARLENMGIREKLEAEQQQQQAEDAG